MIGDLSGMSGWLSVWSKVSYSSGSTLPHRADRRFRFSGDFLGAEWAGQAQVCLYPVSHPALL